MKTFEIRLRGFDNEACALVNSETAGMAKYKYFLTLDGLFDSFQQYLQSVRSCKCVAFANRDNFSCCKGYDFEKTKKYRQVPLAEIGTVVELNGNRGVIVGANDSCNFDVAFGNGVYNCHPHHKLVYFNKDGSIMYDFRKRR